MELVESRHVGVLAGGRWTPVNCTAWQKIAIIVTYRDRHEQLVLLLNRLHTLLQRQMMYYQIFVIQQVRLFLLWPPYVIGGPLYFCPVVSIFYVSIYLSIYLSFFSSPNLSGRRLDVYHTSTHVVALVRI